MKDVNKAILLGRLGTDPVQRHTKTGKPVVHFPMATSRRFYRETEASLAEGSLIEETQWHQIVVWGIQADACARYLKKGQSVYVEGFFKTHSYDDKNGVTRISTEVHAETVSFLNGSRASVEETAAETPADIPI